MEESLLRSSDCGPEAGGEKPDCLGLGTPGGVAGQLDKGDITTTSPRTFHVIAHENSPCSSGGKRRQSTVGCRMVAAAGLFVGQGRACGATERRSTAQHGATGKMETVTRSARLVEMIE